MWCAPPLRRPQGGHRAPRAPRPFHTPSAFLFSDMEHHLAALEGPSPQAALQHFHRCAAQGSAQGQAEVKTLVTEHLDKLVQCLRSVAGAVLRRAAARGPFPLHSAGGRAVWGLGSSQREGWRAGHRFPPPSPLPPPPHGQKLHSGFPPPPRQVDALSSTEACLS